MRDLRLWEVLLALGLLVILLFMLIPSMCTRPERGYRPSCLNNIKQLGLALKQYVQDFGDVYPWRTGAANPDEAWLDLGMLYPNYTSSWKSFLCPDAKDRRFEPRCAHGDKIHYPLEPLYTVSNKEVISYAYCIDASDPGHRIAWTENAPATVRLLADRKAGTSIGSPGNPAKMANHGDDGRNVLYHDCHVKWKPGARALDPDEDNDAAGAPNAKHYRIWWSDPPYYGE